MSPRRATQRSRRGRPEAWTVRKKSGEGEGAALGSAAENTGKAETGHEPRLRAQARTGRRTGADKGRTRKEREVRDMAVAVTVAAVGSAHEHRPVRSTSAVPG
ncbi:hypothetical protein GCM10010420_48470 [Streptomyces glaucosporus]|uniref:Uncharacterized protein n=1 Tax=Streptomyces glaucosporus TaxID=284044 RepID=A0ABN3ISS6_9ACTN